MNLMPWKKESVTQSGEIFKILMQQNLSSRQLAGGIKFKPYNIFCSSKINILKITFCRSFEILTCAEFDSSICALTSSLEIRSGNSTDPCQKWTSARLELMAVLFLWIACICFLFSVENWMKNIHVYRATVV